MKINENRSVQSEQCATDCEKREEGKTGDDHRVILAAAANRPRESAESESQGGYDASNSFSVVEFATGTYVDYRDSAPIGFLVPPLSTS